jgi:RNA polymerase sigma-70 factor, ECF subfamily
MGHNTTENENKIMNKAEDTTQIFQRYRLLLFSIAYRMLGSASDAEDIVQETFLRWLEASDKEVQSPKAYLSTIVVRLCLDQLRSAREQREVYVGSWLPEPIATGQIPELSETAVQRESLALAFLLMLEKLTPLQRAIFLLREVFEYDYSEIATIVEKSEVNGQPALVGYLNEKPVGAILLQIEGEQILHLYYVVNPEKLNWLSAHGAMV